MVGMDYRQSSVREKMNQLAYINLDPFPSSKSFSKPLSSVIHCVSPPPPSSGWWAWRSSCSPGRRPGWGAGTCLSTPSLAWCCWSWLWAPACWASQRNCSSASSELYFRPLTAEAMQPGCSCLVIRIDSLLTHLGPVLQSKLSIPRMLTTAITY